MSLELLLVRRKAFINCNTIDKVPPDSDSQVWFQTTEPRFHQFHQFHRAPYGRQDLLATYWIPPPGY